MQIKGVLFDMDGVLVDSEAFICEAAMAMFSEYGLQVKPRDFLPYVGAGENRYLGGVAEKYKLKFDIKRAKSRTYDIYSEKVNGKLQALPGVLSFISLCKEKGIKMAVATSADKIKMHINLNEMGIPEDKFDATVTGSEVEHKKPHPEVFLTAANKLGLKPSECLVVEDAVNGIQAANAAGCSCLALSTSFPESQLQEAHWICTNLSTVPNEIINLLKA